MFNVLDLFDYEWITTILEKSSWDSKSTSAVLSKYPSNVRKSSTVLFLKWWTPPPSAPPNRMLKDQRNCGLTVSTLSMGWKGEGWGGVLLVERECLFSVCWKALVLYNCRKALSMIVGIIWFAFNYRFCLWLSHCDQLNLFLWKHYKKINKFHQFYQSNSQSSTW